MKEKHFQLVTVVETLDFSNTIAFEPDGAKILILLQILDGRKSLIVQIEGIDQCWCLELSVLLAELN